MKKQILIIFICLVCRMFMMPLIFAAVAPGWEIVQPPLSEDDRLLLRTHGPKAIEIFRQRTVYCGPQSIRQLPDTIEGTLRCFLEDYVCMKEDQESMQMNDQEYRPYAASYRASSKWWSISLDDYFEIRAVQEKNAVEDFCAVKIVAFSRSTRYPSGPPADDEVPHVERGESRVILRYFSLEQFRRYYASLSAASPIRTKFQAVMPHRRALEIDGNRYKLNGDPGDVCCVCIEEISCSSRVLACCACNNALHEACFDSYMNDQLCKNEQRIKEEKPELPLKCPYSCRIEDRKKVVSGVLSSYAETVWMSFESLAKAS